MLLSDVDLSASYIVQDLKAEPGSRSHVCVHGDLCVCVRTCVCMHALVARTHCIVWLVRVCLCVYVHAQVACTCGRV